MAEAQYAPNHTIDPETGFIENRAYPYAFTADKKQQFIKCLVENGLGIYETCEVLGMKHDTFIKHYHNDPAFKQALDEARSEYGSRLDALSKRNAMNPRSVIERIFQLKSIFPDKYGDQRSQGPTQININLDGKMLEMVSKREQILEAEVITSSQTEAVKSIDKQGERVLVKPVGSIQQTPPTSPTENHHAPTT